MILRITRFSVPEKLNELFREKERKTKVSNDLILKERN